MMLKVKGVPALYLPYMYYPLSNDNRSTGFLMPSYGSSTYKGHTISNAFFWAINRSQDATFLHDWYLEDRTIDRRRVSIRLARRIGQLPNRVS